MAAATRSASCQRRRRTSRRWPTTSRTCSPAAYTAGVSRGLTSALAIHVDGVFNQMSKIPMAIDINPRSGGTTGNAPADAVRADPADTVDWRDGLQGAARPAREAIRAELHVHGVVHAREHRRHGQQHWPGLDGHRFGAPRLRQWSEQQRPAQRTGGERVVPVAG